MCLGLGLEVYCLGLGLGLEPCCLGLGLGLGIYCLGHKTVYYTVSPFFLKSGLKKFVGIAE